MSVARMECYKCCKAAKICCRTLRRKRICRPKLTPPPPPPPPPLNRTEKVKWSAVTHGLLIAQCTYSGLLQLVVWQILNERGGEGGLGVCNAVTPIDAFFMFKWTLFEKRNILAELINIPTMVDKSFKIQISFRTPRSEHQDRHNP